MSTAFNWGAYGQQGADRQQQQEELARRQEARRREIAQLQARIPAWEDGVRQCERLLVEARAQHAAAVEEAGRRWDDLEKACFLRQRGECARSAEGLPVMDANHPDVARQKEAWEDAQQVVARALRRIHNLEVEKAYYAGWIGTARSTT